MRARPSLRANGSREYAPDRHCEQSEAIQSRKKGWIASSLTLLAMTGRTPAQGVLRPSLRANGSRECAPDRHCERSEAIQSRKKGWIASSLTLLAMTGPDTGARSFETVIASEAKQSRAARKNGLLRR